MAREIPVLPDVGSRMVAPGARSPADSAASIIASAGRSLTEPVGLRSSSLAQRRTSGDGESRGSPTSGVPPTESISESKRTRGPGRSGGPARDRGQDGDVVAVADRRGQPAEETDVLVVEVDVDEAAQLVVLDQSLPQAWVPALQIGEELVDRRPGPLDGLRAFGVGTKD